jgi:hypothetical protein
MNSRSEEEGGDARVFYDALSLTLSTFLASKGGMHLTPLFLTKGRKMVREKGGE